MVLLLALLSITWWLLRGSETHPPQVAAAPTHDSDYYVNGFRTLALGEDGNRRYQLAADRLVHHLSDDSTEMDQPRYSRFDSERGSLRIQAETGQGNHDNSVLRLLGSVRITNLDENQRPKVETRTDALTLYPNRDFAETHSPVTIDGINSTTRGIGMTVDSQAGKLVLLSRVESIYYPTGKPSDDVEPAN